MANSLNAIVVIQNSLLLSAEGKHNVMLKQAPESVERQTSEAA